MSYLDGIDLVMLRLAYSIIQEKNDNPWDKGIAIDKDFLKRHPVATFPAVYKAIGGSGRYLSLDWINNKDLVKLLPFIPKIKELALSWSDDDVDLFRPKVIKQFPALECLSLHIDDSKDFHIHLLMNHLAPTLESLTYNQISLTPLLPLRNLAFLRLNFSGESRILKQILDQNVDLEVAVDLEECETDDSRNWSVLANSEQLTKLSLETARPSQRL